MGLAVVAVRTDSHVTAAGVSGWQVPRGKR